MEPDADDLPGTPTAWQCIGCGRLEAPQSCLGELEYPFHDRTVTITHCGRICLGKRKINFSQVFAGQNVGIKEVADQIWLVTFMQYDLGYIDLEQKTLQPLDNPFGARLLPMS